MGRGGRSQKVGVVGVVGSGWGGRSASCHSGGPGGFGPSESGLCGVVFWFFFPPPPSALSLGGAEPSGCSSSQQFSLQTSRWRGGGGGLRFLLRRESRCLPCVAELWSGPKLEGPAQRLG